MSTDKQAPPHALAAFEPNPERVELVRRTVAQGASPDELALFFYDCQRRGVHPLDRLIHFTKRGNRYTPITSIDYMRSRAADSGEHAGTDDAEFGPDRDGKPEWAKVTVYRLVQGNRFAFGATARWLEYFPGDAQGTMWRKMPHTMLAKCAEALALRKAFPQQLAGLYSSEEMDQGNEKRPASSGNDAQEQVKAERLADEAFGPKARDAAIDQAIAKVSPRAARADHDISDRPDTLESPNFGLRNLARARFEDVMAAEVKAHRRSRFYLRDSADWKRDNGRQHLADLLGLMIGREVEPGDFNSLTAEEWDKAAHRLDEYGQQLAEKASQKAQEGTALPSGSQLGAGSATHHGNPSEQHGRDATDGVAGQPAGAGSPSGRQEPALPPKSTEVPLPEDARMRIVAAIRRLYGFPNSGKGVRMALDKLGYIHKERTGVARAFLRADAIPYDLAEEMLTWLEARQTPSREELETAKEPQ